MIYGISWGNGMGGGCVIYVRVGGMHGTRRWENKWMGAVVCVGKAMAHATLYLYLERREVDRLDWQ